jgi:peroxiredoxin Q/BCP
MPRKATATSADEGGDQAAPRRSTRIKSQPRTEETKPAPKPRATKKRTADDANATQETGEEKAKAKKVSFSHCAAMLAWSVHHR